MRSKVSVQTLTSGGDEEFNMLTTVMLLALLMLGGLRGAAASDFHVFGKSIHDDETLQSSSDRVSLRKQPRQQVRTDQ